MNRKRIIAAGMAVTTFAGVAAVSTDGVASATGHEPARERNARILEVTVDITNLAPADGTSQTPVWVGIHDGGFDLYDRDAPISPELERLAEDGNNQPIIDLFAATANGEDAVAPGPNGPIAPGETATTTFFIDTERGEEQFFSYASMILPSNDAFVANGDPTEHRIVNKRGRFTPTSFVVSGSEVLDAGSEVNDEVPANTAFFGQAAPDTGVAENGVVVTHPGFQAPVSDPVANILGTPGFANGDFTADGYDALRFDISAKRVQAREFTFLDGNNEVPAADTAAWGRARLRIERDGDLDFRLNVRPIDNVLFGHIHLGQPGENGPVVANLFDGDLSKRNRLRVDGEIASSDLVGPMAGMSTLDLWQEIQAGNAYINIHSTDFPDGEVRGNLGGW